MVAALSCAVLTDFLLKQKALSRCIALPKPAILKIDVVVIVFFEMVYEPCLSLSNVL